MKRLIATAMGALLLAGTVPVALVRAQDVPHKAKADVNYPVIKAPSRVSLDGGDVRKRDKALPDEFKKERLKPVNRERIKPITPSATPTPPTTEVEHPALDTTAQDEVNSPPISNAPPPPGGGIDTGLIIGGVVIATGLGFLLGNLGGGGTPGAAGAGAGIPVSP